MNTLDDIRAAYPHLGLGLYALDPRGPVILECLSADGKTFKFTGATEAEAVALAFPDEDTPTPPKPAPTVSPPSESPSPSSVFD